MYPDPGSRPPELSPQSASIVLDFDPIDRFEIGRTPDCSGVAHQLLSYRLGPGWNRVVPQRCANIAPITPGFVTDWSPDSPNSTQLSPDCSPGCFRFARGLPIDCAPDCRSTQTRFHPDFIRMTCPIFTLSPIRLPTPPRFCPGYDTSAPRLSVY